MLVQGDAKLGARTNWGTINESDTNVEIEIQYINAMILDSSFNAVVFKV